MMLDMSDAITLLGGAAAAWSLGERAGGERDDAMSTSKILPFEEKAET
jgi:hypothetical protein